MKKIAEAPNIESATAAAAASVLPSSGSSPQLTS